MPSDEDAWSRGLAQAEVFARSGNWDEAVARVLAVRSAVRARIDETAPGDAALSSMRHFLRSLDLRFERLHAGRVLDRARTTARSEEHRQNEQRALSEPLRGPPIGRR